jgi:hypothetical protein
VSARKVVIEREAKEMNGFASHGLDEDAFGEKRGNIVQAFDAFRMSFLSELPVKTH